MTALRTLGIVSSAFTLGASLEAQSISVLARDGDTVAGVGNITAIDNLTVNDAGIWLVEAATDHANGDANTVLLKSGIAGYFLREGDALAAPAGATIDSFDALTLNAGGTSAWNFFLMGTPTNADSGLFLDGTLILQEGTFSSAPQLSPGTPYIGFFETKWSDANELLVVASVDDPAIPSTVDRVLTRFVVAPGGAIVSENVLFKEGDSILGIPVETIAELGTSPETFALANGGHVGIFIDLTGATTSDGLMLVDGLVVAREGSASPVAGRNWELLSSRPIDVNARGNYVYRGNLDGATTDDEVIVKDNLWIVAREGASLPAIGGVFTFTAFGSGPISIDDAGNIVWYGTWNDPDTTRNEGLFVNDRLIVQKGVTQVGTQTITDVSAVESGFALSHNGRYLVFECQVGTGVDAALLANLGSFGIQKCLGDAPSALCPCGNFGALGHGCASSVNANGGLLLATGSPSLSADTLVLRGTSMSNSPALYFQGVSMVGVAGAVFGDGLRCAGGTIVRLGTKVNVGRASQYPVAGDPSVSVRGLISIPGSTRVYQVWYRNAAAFCTSSTFNLTNGLFLEWGS